MQLQKSSDAYCITRGGGFGEWLCVGLLGERGGLSPGEEKCDRDRAYLPPAVFVQDHFLVVINVCAHRENGCDSIAESLA